MTDAYGYAIYVDDAALSVGSYVYISAIANQTNLSTKVIGDAYFTDGVNEEIVIKNIYAADGSTDLAAGLTGGTTKLDDATIKGWYSYSKNSKDEYTLTKATNTGALATNKIDQNKVSIAGTVSGNEDTIFVVKDKNDNITVYTGIKNVPDITGITTTNSYYLRDKDTAGKPASAVFVDASSGSVKNSTESALYLLKLDSTTVDNTNQEPVYVWQVLLDGEYTTISTKQAPSSALWAVGKMFENYSTDSDGYYELDATDVFDYGNDTDKFSDTLVNATISSNGDTLSFGGRTVVIGDDTLIKLIMAPTTKGSGILSNVIMSDNDADYEQLTMRASSLANKFKDGSGSYFVNGNYFVTYDDKSGSDLITSLYVVVTSVSGMTAEDEAVVEATQNTQSFDKETLNNAGVTDGNYPADITVNANGTEITATGTYSGKNTENWNAVWGYDVSKTRDQYLLVVFGAPTPDGANGAKVGDPGNPNTYTGLDEGLMLGVLVPTDTLKTTITVQWTKDGANFGSPVTYTIDATGVVVE